MTIDSVRTLVEALCHERLLSAEQRAALTDEVLDACDTPQFLAKYLIQLDWLTVYQVNHLFEGHAQDLVLGPYCILDRLGEGGVSEVYKARDGRQDRLVALKVLRQHLLGQDHAVRQFEREQQAVTRLNHPNVIKTYDADRVGDSLYFAMEFVEGTDLGKVVQLSGPLGIGEACGYVRQVAAGLQHAHQLGLVHRDIKPANLFLVRPATATKRAAPPLVKIIDWGLARMQHAAEAPADASSACSAGSEEGMLVGTADFIAPEQARDPRLVDIRADIYSLGCTFYYLLTGQPPFPGASLMKKLMQHQQAEPAPVQSLRADVPEELAAIIHKMLAKQPETRYQIPLAVAVPLRRFCDTPGPNATSLRTGPGHPADPPSLSGSFRRPR